jgi:L-fuconolactonase
MSTDTGCRIDAHHHLWDLSVRDQPWTESLPVLRRSFSMDDLVPELDAHDIDGTILVQTVTVAEETPEFLALAAGNPRILGVVGWVDLTAPDVAATLARLKALPGGDRLVGIRHQVQLETDPAWLLRDDVRRGLEAVAAAGLVYELLVTHDQLPAAVAVVGQVPGMRWVLDHAGKPPIAAGSADDWRDHIAALAAHPNVACKLSGLVTEAADDWTPEELQPFASHVLESFGADRVMVGSDWPVCLLRTTYDEVIALSELLVAGLAPGEQLMVWGETASRWYGLTF